MDPKNSTIIINANVLTMDEHLNAYPNGYIKITDGLIEAVGEDFWSETLQGHIRNRPFFLKPCAGYLGY